MLSSIAIVMAFLAGLPFQEPSYSLYDKWPMPAIVAPDSLIVMATVVKREAFYIGLDNHLDVIVPNATAADLEVTTSNDGSSITHERKNRYKVQCSKAGKMTIHIADKRTGKKAQTHVWVKPIPQPTIQLGRCSEDLIKTTQSNLVTHIKAPLLRKQRRLVAHTTTSEIKVHCPIVSFEMFYSSNGENTVKFSQKGGRFTKAVRRVVARAKPYDQYAFTQVKVRCPGDIHDRIIPGLAFGIR